MKRLLVILLILIVGIGAGMLWLANVADSNPPQEGEQRLKVDHDLY